MRKNFLLLINTGLLAILTLYSVLNVHEVQNEIRKHRLRNEAENFCQYYFTFPKPGVTLEQTIKEYKACVDDKSGQTSPLREK